MAGRQSVMGQTVATGSSGVGFALRMVAIKEVNAAQNICQATDIRTNEGFQLGLNKRGDSAIWPQIGEAWLIDRSMGHWALKSKITATTPPAFTSPSPSLTQDLSALVHLLAGAGLIENQATTGNIPVITGSQQAMTTGTEAIIAALAYQGLVIDATTPATTTPGVWVTSTSYVNGWVAGSLTSPTLNAALRYQLLPGGTHVELNGYLHSGTSSNYTTMFSLASAFVPAYDQTLLCFRQDNMSTCWVKILGAGEGSQAGNVQILSGSSTTIAGVNLQIAGTYPLN